MKLDLTKRDPKIIKEVIFEIAKNNGIAVSEIGKNTNLKLNYQTVKNQIKFLSDSTLLDYGRIEKDILRGKGYESDIVKSVKFKQDIETFKEIAKIFDNKELCKFMQSKYYQDNVKEYLTYLINSMEQNKLYQLPEADYFEYALKNSPSSVRFFLIDNDINLLISFYTRGISLLNDAFKANNETKEIIGKINYSFWDQTIFGKIQEDALNNILLNPDNDFINYFPIAKKIVENMLEIAKIED